MSPSSFSLDPGLPLTVTPVFASWYASAAATFGSLFTPTVPLNFQGNLSAVTADITLANGESRSQTVRVTIAS